MNASPIDVTITDGIITVTFDRQDKLNAINNEMTAELWEATERLASDDDLRCMLITAKGRYFSAGIDLNDPPIGAEADMSADQGMAYRRAMRRHHLLYDEFEAIEKPIVLAAQNSILGAGVEMAVSCDFRFCTPQAAWRLPEIDIGVLPGSGGIGRLTRLVGPAWAKYLAVAGMKISADEAKQMGLVHAVFPEEIFLEQVYGFCRRLVSLPAGAIGLGKLTVDLAADNPDRNAQRHLDRIVNSTLVSSAEHSRRIGAFREK
jgi:enoyl-CoA hydratase/carnithine racemase